MDQTLFPQTNAAPQGQNQLMVALQALAKLRPNQTGFQTQNGNQGQNVSGQSIPGQQQGSGGALSQYLQQVINPNAAQLPWQNQGIGGLIDKGAESGIGTLIASLFGG